MDNDDHPALEHIEALDRAKKYMTDLMQISPGYEQRKQGNQAQEIERSVPRGILSGPKRNR